jgi:hypothetical protein
MPRILAFDIGIKNLAWCCADILTSNITVRGWTNENLLTGTNAEEEVEKSTCELCKKRATYQKEDKIYCVQHCPALTPALRDLSGNLLRKLPAAQAVKLLAKSSGATSEQCKTKDTSILFLKGKFCFPKVSGPKVKAFDLETIHDGIKDVVNRNKELFSSCSNIYLENQPAFKNPVMKSVQMMLFATLRTILPGPPRLHLVHAGKKTVGATKGDEGYKDRKNASEVRIQKAFEERKVNMICHGGETGWFMLQKKRSDLADCLCMVMDAASKLLT